MSDIPLFIPPIIIDRDIYWASNLLQLPAAAFYGSDGNDPRHEVLKSMEQIDIAACPGSGKTTLLVAKLAILAERWHYHTRGICVLSHTNVARKKIEDSLGNTAVGRRILSYPHYIGTIHGFVNEFLALPWLRSLGYPIKLIDNERCLERRWWDLLPQQRRALEKNHHSPGILSIKSPDFGVGEVHWGKGSSLRKDTTIYQSIINVCRQSIEEGYFCYDEMFVWARDLLEKVPNVVNAIRNRFPLLFIDEAQDNSEVQSAILQQIFISGKGPTLRQRFGDSNQAIYNFINDTGATTDKFPNDPIKTEIPNSHRFGQKIANLADPLGLIPYNLVGQGPQKPLASGLSDMRHTIFIFNENSVSMVLDAYGELLVETFSELELRNGKFTAVGQVHHRPPDDREKQRIPHYVGHYWSDYDPKMARRDFQPRTFKQYIFDGIRKTKATGEVYLIVEKIAEGILHLSGLSDCNTPNPHKKYKHRYILQVLEKNRIASKCYKKLVAMFVAKLELPTQRMWNYRLRSIVRKIAEILAGVSLSGPKIDAFLSWDDGISVPQLANASRINHDNIYQYPHDNPEVNIQIGSIHSVKGETHTAILVLETFWNKYNLDSLLQWLNGDNLGAQSVGPQQQSRLKVHYVAMTRPTHLLCLAIKNNGGIDQNMIQKLKSRGWQIKVI